MVDMVVKAKKYSTAMKHFSRKYPNLSCYMESLAESLQNMMDFYKDGLNDIAENYSCGIIYKPETEEYREWNEGIYSVGIEHIDEDRIYLYVNTNEKRRGQNDQKNEIV